MPRKSNYLPDAGKNALIGFYNWYDINSFRPDGFLNEVIEDIEKEYQGSGKVNIQIGTWLTELDPNIVGAKISAERIKRFNIPCVILKASYRSCLEKLLDLAKYDKITSGLKTGWLNKFVDPASPYYCDQFQKDLEKIDPKLAKKNIMDHTQQKKWLCVYVREAKLHPLYHKTKDTKALATANKEYPLKRNRVRITDVFADYCYPESELFDPKVFEICFRLVGYKVDGLNPNNSVKDLIIRVLSAGKFIDNPSWHLFLDKSNESLWCWFERYTTKDSKYYDKKFDLLLRKDFPQQYSMTSLKYQGLRQHDQKKDNFLKELKTDPTVSLEGWANHIGADLIFQKMVKDIKEQWRKDHNISIAEERNNFRKEEILKKLKQGIDFNNFELHFKNKTREGVNKELLMPWLVKFTSLDTMFSDTMFRKQVKLIDPELLECIDNEYKNPWPNQKRLQKNYRMVKLGEKEELWIAVSPGWEVLPWLDKENKNRQPGYQNRFDPSFIANVRKITDANRDTFRTVWKNMYGIESPKFTGNDFKAVLKDQRSLPYTWNLGNSKIFYGKTIENLSRALGDSIDRSIGAKMLDNGYFVMKKGNFMGYTFFRKNIEPNKNEVFEYLNNL